MGDNTVKEGGLALQQEHETITGQVMTVKELAISVSKDISSCLQHREEALNRAIYTMELFRCVDATAEECEKVLTDAKYIIGISINADRDLEHTTIKKIQPRDIIDEAQKQLDELKRIVQGDIMVAHDELDNAKTDFFTFSDNTIKDGAVALQQEHETIVGQVTTLKELAHSAGKDISSCTEHREDAINRLPGIYSMEMFRCVRGKTDESDRIVKDSKYIVDIAINTVHHLQQQLDRCGNNILCVEPVVTEIQLDMVRLPANIKTEVTSKTVQEIKPRDVISEAKEQLEELKRIVQGDILAAHDELNNLLTDFLTFGDNVLKGGELAIQQEHETIIGQLTTIKDLAHSAGKDISVCTDIRENALNTLAGTYSDQLFHCIVGKSRAANKIVEDARYIVDISINKVRELEHQLNSCGEDILCVSPIVTEIQLDMIRLPQNIKTEVNAAGKLLNILKLSVEECANVKDIAIEANAIVPLLSDLIDDAKAELEKLRQIVTGAILAAEDELSLLYQDFQVYSVNILNEGTFAIEQNAGDINGKLTTIKDLAQSAGVDISYCLRGREDYLKKLPEVITKELNECIFDKVEDASRVMNDAKYIVDITITSVEKLANELTLCGSDEDASDLCVKPVLDQIDLEIEQLPEMIKIEVNKAIRLYEPLRVSVQECSSLKVGEYGSAANKILNDIVTCISL
ncbi:hypothetical protein BDFB_005026 [Asbolus verrucosus]|uniref:Uncharacterized protein n=1 Tax=Asbolus verrucosus TaxID=1661398 RepID=A0A482W9C4_ASBVE|nr:hypothetical protein BDFB_005026 [Asbolus verrucosus]